VNVKQKQRGSLDTCERAIAAPGCALTRAPPAAGELRNGDRSVANHCSCFGQAVRFANIPQMTRTMIAPITAPISPAPSSAR
jgi:hypothetical protein